MPTYPVTGKVVLEDGKPVTSGTIYFNSVEAPGITAKGELNTDGSFTLTTRSKGDGAAQGENRVYIEPDPTAIVRTGKRVTHPFPVQYMDEEGTPLVVTVKPEANQLEPIVLKKVLASRSGNR